MVLIATMALAVALSAPTVGAPQRAAPDLCRPDARGRVDFQACADAAIPGSAERSLALINLATQAFLAGDYAKAVRLYDEALPPGGRRIYSDATFHAYRAAAYDHVGRTAEALDNARTSLAIMRHEKLEGMPDLPAEATRNTDPEALLPHILPILKRGGDPGYAAALVQYRALPATDWISYSNRAAALNELGDVPGALAANREALKLAPDHPGPLNNACYILAGAGRAAEGLPFCERAVKAAPGVAAVHDSYATALSALGRCKDAEAELALARKLDPSSVDYQRALACVAR